MFTSPQTIEAAAHLSNGRRFASWIVDQVVTVTIILALGLPVALGVEASAPTLSSAAMFLVFLVVALVLPVLYGLLCFNGRSIGCLVAGTAFFSVATGKRAHNARMMWVMGHRWLWPILAIMFVVSLFDAGVTPTTDHLHAQRRVRGVAPAPVWAPPPVQAHQQQPYARQVQPPYPPQPLRPQPPRQQPSSGGNGYGTS